MRKTVYCLHSDYIYDSMFILYTKNIKMGKSLSKFKKISADEKNYMKNFMPLIDSRQLKSAVCGQKTKTIHISDDTLTEIIGLISFVSLLNILIVLAWISRSNLPNVDLINYRFWCFCEPRMHILWPHFIGRIRITGKKSDNIIDHFVGNQMEILHGLERKLVSIASIEPPRSILGIRIITIRDFIGEETLKFLSRKGIFSPLVKSFIRFGLSQSYPTVIKNELADCVLIFRDLHNFFDSEKPSEFVDTFFAVFTKCYKIELCRPSCLVTENFFQRKEVSNCSRLFIWDALPDFKINSLLNWLHSSKQPSSSNQKWLFLDLRFTPMEMIVDFLEDIKKRFEDAEKKKSFIVQIYPADKLPEIFLYEQFKTKEILVLYRVPNRLSYRLRRCARSDVPVDICEFVQDSTPQVPYFPFILKAMTDRNRTKVLIGPLKNCGSLSCNNNTENWPAEK